MYAIIETGGKQYRVAPGDVIRVERLPMEAEQTVSVGRVLAVAEDSAGLRAGLQVASARVEGTVLRHGRSAKIPVFHFKRKKQYKKMFGHRQWYTEVRIDKVVP